MTLQQLIELVAGKKRIKAAMALERGFTWMKESLKVQARINRWKNTDVGDSSLYGYTHKIK